MPQTKKKLIIAVDFDGTLCQTDFPKILKQTEKQKKAFGKFKKITKKWS